MQIHYPVQKVWIITVSKFSHLMLISSPSYIITSAHVKVVWGTKYDSQESSAVWETPSFHPCPAPQWDPYFLVLWSDLEHISTLSSLHISSKLCRTLPGLASERKRPKSDSPGIVRRPSDTPLTTYNEYIPSLSWTESLSITTDSFLAIQNESKSNPTILNKSFDTLSKYDLYISFYLHLVLERKIKST